MSNGHYFSLLCFAKLMHFAQNVMSSIRKPENFAHD